MQWVWTYDEKIASRVQEGVDVIKTLIEHLESSGWSAKQVFGVHMSMEEAVMNAIKHGNERDESKQVHVIMKTSEQTLYVKVTDQGEGFQPDHVPDCTTDENLEKTSGRGLMLMKNYMDSVIYNAKGNSVEMTKSKDS